MKILVMMDEMGSMTWSAESESGKLLNEIASPAVRRKSTSEGPTIKYFE